MRLIFDTEGDGFLSVITKMHTIVCKDYDTDEIKTFDPDNIESGIRYIYSADVLICHNSTLPDPIMSYLATHITHKRSISIPLLGNVPIIQIVMIICL